MVAYRPPGFSLGGDPKSVLCICYKSKLATWLVGSMPSASHQSRRDSRGPGRVVHGVRCQEVAVLARKRTRVRARESRGF